MSEPGSTVDAALETLAGMFARDGYQLNWEASPEDRIIIRIEALGEACADCLIPQNLIETMASSALAPTSYSLDRVVMPAESAH